MTTLISEFLRASRALRRAKGFTAAAVLTLALGMALCITAMVVLNAYLLTGLPYPAADRLFWIRYSTPGQDGPRSMEALDWPALDDVIEHPIAWDLDVFYLLGGDHAESVPGAWVTRGFVEGLGIRPALGRGFDNRAFDPGSANVVLISHRLWTTRFGQDPDIMGKRFTAYVSDRPNEAEDFTIIGVLPPAFWHVNAYTEVLAPLRAPTFPYMARLRPGVSPGAATQRVTELVTAGARNVPSGWSAQLVSAHDAYVTQVRPTLRIVAVAAVLVLLVGCANVAGLLLVRAAKREREIAIRTALGAGWTAILRMLLAEALLIGGSSTALSLVASFVTLSWLGPLVQQQLGRPAPGGLAAFAFDGRFIGLATGIGMVTILVCTVVPLASAMRSRVLEKLQGGSRSATEGQRTKRTRQLLMALEVAASLTLLAGTALMLRSVLSMLQVDLGFHAERVLNASVTLRQNRYPDPPSRLALFDRMLAEVGAMPGTEAVGLTDAWPVQEPNTLQVGREGAAPDVQTAIQSVSHGYFETLGIEVVAGRAFTGVDRIGAEPVAIVSESLARRLWTDGDPLGSRLLVQERQPQLAVARRIVGIVRDVRQGPSDHQLADLYLPLMQRPGRFAFVLVRTAGAPTASLPGLRRALGSLDAELAPDRARPMQLALDEITARPRFMGFLLAVFAAIATVLAVVGMYGVIAYAVRQREREIAVRLAVGAEPSAIVGLFLRQGAVIVASGLAVGAVTTLAAGRLIESQLFGVTPRDPIALGLAVAVFAGAGLIGVWWPARRAATTDPALALKAE